MELVHLEENINKASSSNYQIGENLFIGSWGEQSLVVCKKVRK